MTKKKITKAIIAALIAGLTALAAGLGLTSCKAWRTISTTATWTQQADSTGKAQTTIATKTIEEYQGVKKK